MIVPELDDNGVATLAVLNAVKQMGDTIKVMGGRMDAQTEKLQELHMDVRIMAVQNSQLDDMKETMARLVERCQALENRNTLQDGAVKGFGAIGKYTPWLVAVLSFLWGLFGHSHN